MNEYIQFLDFNSIVFEQKSINKLFNGVEDLCYAYNNLNIDETTKKDIEVYLSNLSVWINQNKEKFSTFNHKYLESFYVIQNNLDKIDNIVAKIVTPIFKETIDNWIAYYKSSDLFYLIQGNHKDNTQLFDISNTAIENTFKSIRTEKFASYHVYVLCGQASSDYVDNADGVYYLKKAEELLDKDLNKIAPSGKLDATVENLERSIILYTTSNITDMRHQNIAENLDKKSTIFVVVNALFNQSYSPIDTYFNGRKAEQHGTSFLSQFSYTELNKDDLGLFNVLPIMSLLNNLKCPNEKYTVSDITKINPFVIGTDTYFLYKAFRDISEYDEPEKTQELLNFYVSYLEKVTDKLSNINKDYIFTQDTLTIFNNLQNTILGVLNNFNKSNIPNEIPDNKTLERLFNVIDTFKNTVGLSNDENRHNINLVNNTILDNIDSTEDLKNFYIKRNKKIGTVYIEKEKKKEPLFDVSKEYIDSILSNINIPQNHRQEIITIIQSRQVNVKDQTFTASALGNNTYQFLNLKKEISVYSDIFKFIELHSDFNNKALLDEFSNYMNQSVLQNTENYSTDDNLLDIAWNKISNNAYQMPIKIREFYNTIEETGELSVHEIRNDKTLGLFNMFNTNIFYKHVEHTNPNSDSFLLKSRYSDKSLFSSELLKALGLYDKDYYSLGNLRQEKISFDFLNQNLLSFLQSNKLKF